MANAGVFRIGSGIGAFWKSKLAELAAVPMNPVLEEVTDSGSPAVQLWKITMDGIRSTKIHGYRPMIKFPSVAVTALMLAPLATLHAADFDLLAPVRIESGLLQGVASPDGDVVAFKGIPYAAPPVGDLRWREPQAPLKWDGIRQVDKFGAPCIQPASPGGKPPPANMSEDCLFLNVWSPANPTKDQLAVLFFIHGGAGFFGSLRVPDRKSRRKRKEVRQANVLKRIKASKQEMPVSSQFHTPAKPGFGCWMSESRAASVNPSPAIQDH